MQTPQELRRITYEAGHCTLFTPEFGKLIFDIVISDGQDAELNQKLIQSVNGGFQDITDLLKQKWYELCDALDELSRKLPDETYEIRATENLALESLVVYTLYERCCQADEAKNPPVHDTS
ncbi:MAG: hypothetical protein A3E38_03035 [Candidatus Moranbacteria bacterium RIFCSPHIGHO2_12_FULL_54_9]|nr:MAG: hypothetical protein A3E38_03035 [Candidatus Moranbacteria bacterium RIFCSPHIGHO2_12_FULL_54_9]